jgi:hypothetical protein
MTYFPEKKWLQLTGIDIAWAVIAMIVDTIVLLTGLLTIIVWNFCRPQCTNIFSTKRKM